MQIPDIIVLDRGKQLCGIVTIATKNWSASQLKQALSNRSINTSVIEKSSALLDFAEKGVTDALRISPHYYNTGEEIETLCDTIKDIVY